MWNFMCPRVRIPCIDNTVLGKLDLIHEQNVKQNVWPWLQPFAKSYSVGVISQ
jgi:hypothetical protein